MGATRILQAGRPYAGTVLLVVYESDWHAGRHSTVTRDGACHGWLRSAAPVTVPKFATFPAVAGPASDLNPLRG